MSALVGVGKGECSSGVGGGEGYVCGGEFRGMQFKGSSGVCSLRGVQGYAV